MAVDIGVKIAGSGAVMDHLDRIEFSDAIDRLQSLVLDVQLPRHTDPAPAVKLFGLGTAYSVALTRDGSAVGGEAVGDVMETHFELQRSDGHRLMVVGLDSLHKLRGQKAAVVREQLSDAEVAQAVAKANGLNAKVSGLGTSKFDSFDPDILDSVYIRRVAQRYNCAAYIAGADLVIESAQGSGSEVSVTWPEELYELSLRSSLDGLITQVTVQGYDRAQEKAFAVQAAPSDLKRISGSDTGVALAQKSFGPAERFLHQSGLFEQTTAKQWAIAELQRKAERFVKGHAVLRGMPELRAGKKIAFKNVPWPYAGTFLISETRHVLDKANGYRTFVEFISDSLPKA